MINIEPDKLIEILSEENGYESLIEKFNGEIIEILERKLKESENKLAQG